MAGQAKMGVCSEKSQTTIPFEREIPKSEKKPFLTFNTCAKRARDLRLSQNITQKELAERVGVAEGTIKRFEHTGEVQFRTLLGIALVLGRLDDFADVFKKSDVPKSLYHPEPEPKRPRQRARKK